MKEHIENTRRQLGELGVMAAQVEAMERKILARAEALIDEINVKLDASRVSAMSGDDGAKADYMHLIEERGRLHLVVAHANKVLSNS